MNAARPLLGVGGAHDPLAHRFGQDLGLVQREVDALADGEARAAHGEGRVAVDDGGDLAGAIHQAIVLDDLGDETELVGALGAEPFVLAHERHAHGHVERAGPGPAGRPRGPRPDRCSRADRRTRPGPTRSTMSAVVTRSSPAPQQSPFTAVRIGLVVVRKGGVASCGASHCG